MSNPPARRAFRPAPYGYTVELINLKTRHVFPPITVGSFPTAVAITA